VAPDWSADWLQREANALLTNITAETALPDQSQAIARETHLAMLRQEMRQNTYDPDSDVTTVSPRRANAIAEVAEHYFKLFMGIGEEYQALRWDYAMPLNAVLTEDETHALGAFFFWTSWASTTNRPGNTITYTSNWPHEPSLH